MIGTTARVAALAAAAFASACGGTSRHVPDVLEPGPGGPDVIGTITPSFRVDLALEGTASGVDRVNFAVPLPAGLLTSADRIRVALPGGAELAAARRALASWPDGSLRAVQVQVEVDVGVTSQLDVEVGALARAGALARVPVADTLTTVDGVGVPRVWVRLPATWLAASGVAGPVLAAADTPAELDAWLALCDYRTWGVARFWPGQADAALWLFDRPTALYLGYAITGDLSPLQSAYKEVALYLGGITGADGATRIAIPSKSTDLKYHYVQGLAIHYLLTGDERYREAAENVAVRAHDLWPYPAYTPGGRMWTERNAGFALLAYEWAAAVSDDRAATFAGWSDTAVAAYLAMQDDATRGWETDARCFAHDSYDHDAGENYGYWGCSPWMSAILADGLDAYARRAGGAKAAAARNGLVRLGKMIAWHGREASGYGRPFYWMGAGVTSAELDGYDEHWGESAYLVGLAWYWSGRSDAALRAEALELVSGLRALGEVGHLRSFNWQCRSAPMAPFFLAQ